MKKIALEEHFWTDGFPHTGKIGADLFEPSFLSLDRAAALSGPFRAAELPPWTQAGIEVSVLSLVSPGVQTERDHARAVREAKRVNDFLAAEIEKHPARYAGFAHLPMQEPEAAAQELERCVRQLRFRGALINGHSNGVYLDDARYLPFWERVRGARRPHLPASRPHAGSSPGSRRLSRIAGIDVALDPQKPALMRCVWS